MATAGHDGMVKVWDCRNWKGALRVWGARGGGAVVEWSQKGCLAVATGGSVNVRSYPQPNLLRDSKIYTFQVYTSPTIHNPHSGTASPPLYLTHPVPHRPLTSLQWAPFQDILTIGHSAGLSSILVPGTGEANFDSAEADPFENKKARREREVKGLLDKVFSLLAI
jgi:U3 small nucleolar RNA-associated protein 7